MKPLASYTGILVLFAIFAVVFAGCGPNSPDSAAIHKTDLVGQRLEGKISPPLTASLSLQNEPQPGGTAELVLSVANALPESQTVEVTLELPENVRLAEAAPLLRRRIGAGEPVSFPFKVHIPDEGRYVISALVSLSDAGAKPLTTTASVLVHLGESGKAEEKPITVRTSDGRTLGITIAE